MGAIFVPVKRYLPLLFFVLSILAAYVAVKGRPPIKHNSQRQQVSLFAGPPDIHFYDKSENKVTLEGFKGKVVLVNLWATWCEPCVAEMPSLNRLQGMMPEDQFKVVAISVDRSSRKKVKDFLQNNGLDNLDLYWDQDRQIPLKWKYEGLPTSFLINREGAIVAQYDGPYEWDEEPLMGEIRALLP